MKNRAVRVAVCLLVVLALAGAAYEIAMLDRRAAAMGNAARGFEEKARQVESGLREVRAAQYASVAAGQGPAFWTARSTALLAAISADLGELGSLEKAASASGISPIGWDAAGAVDDLAAVQRIDASVRGYLRDEQRLLASDLVFTDLREANQALALRVADARRQMAAGHGTAAEQVRKAQIATAGGAAAFAVLVLLLLVPSGRVRAAESAGASGAIGLGLEGRAPALDASRRGADDEVGSPSPTTPSPAIAHAAIDLNEAASLCTDFARLRESAEVPALLERVARLLDASGIVIWLDDALGGELRPALSVGYPPQALARIHAISHDDDSATARAYRERTLRVVQEDPLSNGAIAAPLLGPDVCVGVMAAEIRHGGEARADVQAAATIVAAQLATLVAPSPAAGSVQS